VKKSLIALALSITAAASLTAQTVGSLPDKSPFLDVHDGMRIGIVAGWLATGSDPVGVGPKSAPTLGVRYDWAIGGPMYLSGSLFGTSTTRTVLDYTKNAANRNIGTQSAGLLVADVSLALSLTGARTWHGLQPLVNLGVGLATGPNDKEDISGYAFSTAFAFSYGFGVRWTSSKNSEIRFDLDQYWWQLKYPENYRSTQGDVNAIRPTGALNAYTINTALTVAYSLRIFR
jgi:hypothetical protein